MKLGIIIDSSSGLNQKEANQKGWGFLPLSLTIDNKDYQDGVDITSSQYYKMINIKMDVKTAATPLGLIENLLEEYSKKFDYVIVYPLSLELSVQYQNIQKTSQKYKNVFVLPSRAIGISIVKDCELIVKKAESKIDWNKLKEYATELTNAQYGIALPKKMDWLVKGGRVSNTIASMSKLLKIVPIIALNHGKLEKFGKGRIFEKTFIKMIKIMKNKYGHLKNYQFSIYHGANPNIDNLLKLAKEYLPISTVVLFPPVIVNHIGPGVVGILAHRLF